MKFMWICRIAFWVTILGAGVAIWKMDGWLRWTIGGILVVAAFVASTFQGGAKQEVEKDRQEIT